jgi:3',5'-cyclic-AMP phosphodiesterase
MPIYLPPISRRQFLTRSLAVGAGLMLSPNLFAATRKVDEHCWALFSDIHIAADRKHIAREINMADNLIMVAKEVIELKKRPAGVLVSGDLALSNGQQEDYATLAELLQPLRAAQLPIHLALGNHDHRERFWDALLEEKTVSRPVVDRQIEIIRTPRANWFVLDSLDKTHSAPGVLGETQLTWLAKSLDANADRPAVIVIHHHPDASGTEKGALVETKELFAIIRPRKQVKAYFFGHTHRWNVAQDSSGIHLINLPPVAYLFDTSLPNGWVLANLEKQGMRLELRCLDRKHKEHGRVLDLKWRI